MKIETIRWKNNRAELIDQRLLPARIRYAKCATAKDMHDAIKRMIVRGAPAIGIAAAYGAYLGIRKSRASSYRKFRKELSGVVKYLAASRPTASNLFWALERIEHTAEKNKSVPVGELKKIILDEAHSILSEDIEMCHAIGGHGARLIKKGSRVLTHCNAGALATGGYGTAVGVIFSARKKIKRVYVDETRPVLQGARLTAWELSRAKMPFTVICDSMAASLMQKGKISAVVVGADRIAANGDAANKIGTYNLAVLASYHEVPFYIAAPFSTFDLSINSGREIPIEERPPEEVRKIGKEYITLRDADIYNPAFDVTPAKLIMAIITERGVIRRPGKRGITEYS